MENVLNEIEVARNPQKAIELSKFFKTNKIRQPAYRLGFADHCSDNQLKK